MTAIATPPVAAAAVLCVDVAELMTIPLSQLGETELLDMLRLAEQARRQLEHLDQLLIAEVEARNLPARYVLRGTSYFLAGCSIWRRVRVGSGPSGHASCLRGCLPPVNGWSRGCPPRPPPGPTER